MKNKKQAIKNIYTLYQPSDIDEQAHYNNSYYNHYSCTDSTVDSVIF